MAEHQKGRNKQRQVHTTGSRARILQVACNLCRRRKTRCDGGRPLCENCLVKGEACVYDALEHESRIDAIRRENEALQARVTYLEAEQAKATTPSSRPGCNIDTPSESELTSESVQARAASVSASHIETRAVDLLHAMATSSDQNASMLLAKLRSGYSWEGLAEEIGRGWQSEQDHNFEPDMLQSIAFTSTATSNDLDQVLDPALRRSSA